MPYHNILEKIGNTPIILINRLNPVKKVKVYAKLEWYNPFGAVKDRIAANMIRQAETQGLLTKGSRLVEATSGNTGLGMAICHSLVSLHGGDITVDSEPGKGTEIVVALPREPPRVSAPRGPLQAPN